MLSHLSYANLIKTLGLTQFCLIRNLIQGVFEWQSTGKDQVEMSGSQIFCLINQIDGEFRELHFELLSMRVFKKNEIAEELISAPAETKF